jgi:branched-chain amino acid transport system substrate-binding protein
VNGWGRRAVGVLAGLGLVAAACGGGDDEADGDGGGGADGSDEPTSTTVAGYTLAEPVRLVAVISDAGSSNDPNAVADFNDGIRMAVEEINGAGGIGGHEVTFEAIETLAVGDTIERSLDLALEEEPTALLGPVSSTAVLAMSEGVDAAGVPMIHDTTEPMAAASGDAGSPWIFGIRPLNDEAAAAAARYAVEELDARELGLLYVNASFGQNGAEAITTEAEDLGAEVTEDRSFEFDADDLTEPVLAMEGVDAILDWGTPNTVGLARTTLAQQGLAEIPYVGPGSMGFASFYENVDPAALEGVHGVLDCNPTGDDREAVADWASRFEDEHGYPPSYASAQMYDAVHLLKHVIDEAQAATPEAIRDGLTDLAGYDGGVCAREYANEDNVLAHEASIVQFRDGEPSTVQRYDDLG